MSPVKAKAECLRKEEGTALGKSLAISLATTLAAEGGIDEWIHQFPALQELDKEYKWFRDMMNIIGRRLVGEVAWGVKFRVFVGASLSTIDLITDILVSYTFYVNDMPTYFNLTAGMVLGNLLMQLMFVYIQYYKLGLKAVVKESIPVITCLKPTVDAYRVAQGVEQRSDTAVDPMMEMTAMRTIELFAEAIPGVIIQLSAMATEHEKISGAAMVSLVSSVFSAAFIGASMSYDWDTDPEKRRSFSTFYGYTPGGAKKRLIVFLSMIGFIGSLLLLRCCTIVVLANIGKHIPFIFVGTDLGVYLLLKLAMGDFWYWVKTGEYLDIFVSITARGKSTCNSISIFV